MKYEKFLERLANFYTEGGQGEGGKSRAGVARRPHSPLIPLRKADDRTNVSDNVDLPRRTVLIADDDQDIRTVIAASLMQLGVEVCEARDGREAIELARTKLPHIAILDGKMPHCDGVAVCQTIKAMPGGETVPVIMLTAMDKVEDKVRALEAGADDYVTKPFNHQELQARVRALLRVRDLNVRLREANEQLRAMQEIMLQQERQVVVSQIAGTAAHQLGQPLSAIMLNCFLLETLPPTDERYKKAVQAIAADGKRMAALIEKLKGADAQKKSDYYGNLKILDIDE